MIESFFFYSGFMIMYLRQKRGKNSAKHYITPLVKKVFRLTLPVFFVLGFAILLPLLGDGPHWHHVIDQAEYLEDNWWKYITHIHIYTEPEQTKFLNVTWFISVLLQLCILISLLLYVKDRWPRIGSLVIMLLMLTGIITHAVDVLSNRYYVMFGVPAVYEKTLKYIRHHYNKPYYSHLTTLCFGALIGDILNKKKEVTFGKITLFVCWIGCIILMALSVFGVHNYKKDILANENIIIAFQCIAPFAWTIGLAWLTVACMTGYGGVVNRLLSLRIFVVLNNLNLWIYLLHSLILTYIFSSLRKAVIVTSLNMWMIFTFALFLSLIAAVFFFVFFESPLNILLSKALRNTASKETENRDENIIEMKTEGTN
ncbi:nose resistant to fluoxetine protein 6-like [Centruroides vittatus]|uniref:nose resistant to fluoxetine protein 6-like n=1 Tax=Centruroides vittatus TaxID=120091 RepID=UPI0035107C6E